MKDFETHERGTAAELFLLRDLVQKCKDNESDLPADVLDCIVKLNYFYQKVLYGESL